MPKDTKTLGNNKTQACESLGFAHKKRGYVCFDTPSCFYIRTRYYIAYQIRITNTLPSLGTEFRVKVPPCKLTICRQILSPIPDPLILVV